MSLLVLSVPSFATTSEANGAARARKTLEQVLLGSEYQPRRHPEGLFDAYRELIGEYINRAFRTIASWFEGIDGPSLGGSSIAQWLIDALLVARNLMLAAVIIFGVSIVLYFAYRLLRPYLLRDEVAPLRQYSGEATPPETSPSLSALLAERRYRELLGMLRLNLRRKMAELYHIPLSATDREALKSVQAAGMELFAEVAILFEKVAYAGHPPDEPAIEALCRRYERSEAA